MTATTPVLPRTPSAPPPLRRREPSPFNLPNQLTALRFVLALVLFALIGVEAWWWAGGVFAVAAFTDWLDGYVARKLDLGSTLGRNLDPLVDKILICGAFICLLAKGANRTGLEAWMVVIVVSRELLVTGLRSFMENRGATFGADRAGKVKMVLQCANLVAILVVLAAAFPGAGGDGWASGLAVVRDLLTYAMVIATVISGALYLLQAVRLLRTEDAANH
jgi:CDP-diacylglycerol--glycerol-3-phosphate 3-phosphatidyltransferase